jgi:hypothetical protein
MHEVKISVCPVNWGYAKKTWRVEIWLQTLHIDIKRCDYFLAPVYLTMANRNGYPLDRLCGLAELVLMLW